MTCALSTALNDVATEQIVSKMLTDMPDAPVPYLVKAFQEHEAYKKETAA